MRSRFDEQLALLNKEMIEMGALCEEVIALASKALTEADPELAQRVMQARQLGRIDGFLYASVTEAYLTAALEAL